MKKRTSSSSGNTDMRRIFVDAAAFLATISLLFLFRMEVMPIVGPVTMVTATSTYRNEVLPFFRSSEGDEVSVFFSVRTTPIRPLYYSVKVDDCIQRLTVNGVTVIPTMEPVVCSPHDFTRVHVGRYLQAGDNALSMVISDVGVTVGVDMHPSATDPLMVAILVAFGVVGAWFLWSVASFLRTRQSSLKPLLALFFLGTFLRLAYVLATPYGERSHDTMAHLEYIRFVLKSWTIPAAAAGWEFHQAPLYYFFAAGVAKAASFIGIRFDAVLPALQGWSLLFSVLSLAVLLATIHLLFPPERRMERWIAGTVVTILPGVIYFSSRITNEALSSFLGFLTLFLIVLWWRGSSDRPWYAAWVVIAVMCLTKISALLFVPVLILCFFLKKGPPLTTRFVPLCLAIAFFTAAVGWYPLLRFHEANTGKTLTLGNQNMDHALTVKRGAKQFLTFNPVAMAKIPYNDSWKDDSRRSNFLEYFFRSAFFGEFQFRNMAPLASVILVLAYIFVLPLIFGIARNAFHPFALLPLHLVAGAVAVVALLYATLFPYAPNQDFRQSVLLALPVAYYVADGIAACPRILRQVFADALVILAVCTGIFMALLYIQS